MWIIIVLCALSSGVTFPIQIPWKVTEIVQPEATIYDVPVAQDNAHWATVTSQRIFHGSPSFTMQAFVKPGKEGDVTVPEGCRVQKLTWQGDVPQGLIFIPTVKPNVQNQFPLDAAPPR